VPNRPCPSPPAQAWGANRSAGRHKDQRPPPTGSCKRRKGGGVRAALDLPGNKLVRISGPLTIVALFRAQVHSDAAHRLDMVLE